MKNWICTKDFLNLKPLNLFAKESDRTSTIPNDIHNYHTLFRKVFYLHRTSKEKYTIKISADDYYKLYVNGTFVGQGPASAYYDQYYYNAYDISDMLKDGKNCICVHCYYQGLINNAYFSGDRRQGMWAELYENDSLILHSDETWKYHVDKSYCDCGIKWGYDTQFVENIDRRKHPIGWKSVEYDDSNWQNALINPTDDHVITEQPTPSVTCYETFPIQITQFSEGNFLLDFGKELVGTVRLKTNGTRGKTVTVKCAEELEANGHARYQMRCNICFDETWTLAGGNDIIENYEYMAFRYVEIETDCYDILPEHFSVIVQHYPIKNKRKIHYENELLNQIWSICENAVIIGTQEGFYDCPSREKAQYLGDLLITALSHYYIAGDDRIFKKALTDFAKTQRVCNGMLAVAPGAFMSEIADYSLLYPLVLYNYYTVTQDIDFLKEMLPTAEKVVTYFERYKRPDGLLEKITDKWNLVDWPSNLRDDYDFPLTVPIGPGAHNVINAYFYGAMKTVNTLRKFIGLPEKFDIKKFKDAYYNAFYDKHTGLFVDSEISTHSSLHSNILPYFYEMTSECENQNIEKMIMDKGFSCGVFFSYFVLKGLAQHGKRDMVMELLLNKSIHSWYNMIQEGATSCFEAWGKEQKANASLCHPWAGTPIIILSEYFS